MASTITYVPTVGDKNSKIPQLGLGCLMYDKDDEKIQTIVKEAVDVGYRHFDTSTVYRSEPSIGQAIQDKIAEGTITRDDVFLVSKLPVYAHQPDDARKAVMTSLRHLRVDYLDLYLIHCPFTFLPTFEFDKQFSVQKYGKKLVEEDFEFYDNDLVATWKVLETCVDEGIIRAIGLSNFNSKQVQRILEGCRIRPANIQIESHPLLNNKALIDFCQDRGLSVTAYAPLATPTTYSDNVQGDFSSVLENEEVKAIAKRHSKTPAQVVLRFQIERNIIVIPKTSNKERLRENIDVFDFELDEVDMKRLYKLNKNSRLFAFHWAMKHKEYPFHEEF